MIQSDNFSFSPIGLVHSPFQEKFAIPRQAGLTQVDAVIELLAPFAQPDAVNGLEQFSHIWIVFVFHAVLAREWKPLVRPPRLGGNEKMGVFATRSTHRPNPIGMSAVELLRVETDGGVRLHVRGADLLDATPVLDIKPYIPYADSIPHARAGFAQCPPPRLPVRWRNEALLDAQAVSSNFRKTVEQVLSLDPRPAYHEESERVYGVRIADQNIRFLVEAAHVEVLSVDLVD